MSVHRIAFLGTPEFASAHLAALIEDPHFEVVGVVTQPDRAKGRHMHLTPSPVKELALQNKIPVITPESIKVESVLLEIASWKAEAAIVVAYGQIVPQKFLDLFPLKVVNVHASLLPRWRGAAPIQRAIEAGDKISGVSLQVMKRKLDAGDVIGSYSLPLNSQIDSFELHDALIPLGIKLLHVDFMDYLRGNLIPTPQDETLVTYAHKIEKEEAVIDWSRSAVQIHNHVRAMVMGPGSVTTFEQRDVTTGAVVGRKKIKFIETEPIVGLSNPIDTRGCVSEVDKDFFTVMCGHGLLRVQTVQPESRSKMSVKDFLLGHKLQEGDHFQ